MTLYTFNAITYNSADLTANGGRGYANLVTTGTGDTGVPLYIAPMIDALADLASQRTTTSVSSVDITDDPAPATISIAKGRTVTSLEEPGPSLSLPIKPGKRCWTPCAGAGCMACAPSTRPTASLWNGSTFPLSSARARQVWARN